MNNRITQLTESLRRELGASVKELTKVTLGSQVYPQVLQRFGGSDFRADKVKVEHHALPILWPFVISASVLHIQFSSLG